MDEEQLLEVPELRDGNVCRSCCLKTLEPGDTNANMGRLDHADVVRPITNGQSHRAQAIFDELDN